MRPAYTMISLRMSAVWFKVSIVTHGHVLRMQRRCWCAGWSEENMRNWPIGVGGSLFTCDKKKKKQWMSRDTVYVTNCVYAQRRLRSKNSFCSPSEESLDICLPTERKRMTNQSAHLRRLIWIVAWPACDYVGNALAPRLKCMFSHSWSYFDKHDIIRRSSVLVSIISPVINISKYIP